MKHILIPLLTFALTSYGQAVGVNGAGFFENATPETLTWLTEDVGQNDFVLRVPGGAIAKFADPRVPSGWGLTYAGIDSIQPKYGSPDEEDQANAIQKWHRKADAQPNYSYLSDVVALAGDMPGLKVIWVANMFISPEATVYALEYLREFDVDVVAVEMGNETYSQFGHDFSAYRSAVNRLRPYLTDNGYPVAHPATPTGTRNRPDHQEWSDSLQAAIAGPWRGDLVNRHRYYDGREYSGLESPIDTILAISQFRAWSFAVEFQSWKDEYPYASGIICTEFNTQPAALIGDTYANAVFVAEFLAAATEYLDYTCIHNGIAPDKYGIIYGDPPRKNTSYAPTIAALGDSCLTYTIYDTAMVQTVVFDTIHDAACQKCTRFWYMLFHWKYCKGCDPFQVVPRTITTEVVTARDTTICGGVTQPPMQALDSDTLEFYNETQFRDFLRYYGIADYEVLPRAFDSSATILDVVPHKWMTNKQGDQVYAPDPAYYDVGIPENEAYLHEDLFAGKQYVSFRDHSHLQKMMREMVPVYCPDGDLFNVWEVITNPVTGQRVKFYNIYRWSDRNGQNIWNENLHLWLLWGFDTQTTTYGIDSGDPETGCDYTFKAWFDGHNDETLYNRGLQETYGHLKIK